MNVIEYMKLADSLAAFYSPEETNQWLTSPHPILEGRIPLDCGYEEVAAIIGQLESGAFT